MILLDTHVLVWLEYGSSRLGKQSLSIIDKALHDGKLAVSAVTFWEIAMLIEKKRLVPDIEPDIWRRDLLRIGLNEIPLRGDTAILAGRLQRLHGDPADRIIVATAIDHSATLVTADKKILDWEGLPQVLDASR